MLYLLGQVLVCLVLTAIIASLGGWLARGYSLRAEVSAMRRQLHQQARELRSRPPAKAKTARGEDHEGSQRQLHHQMKLLQAQLTQRDKEISQLRKIIGDKRRRPQETASAKQPASDKPTSANAERKPS